MCSPLAQVLDLRGVLSCRHGGWLRGCLPGITSGANPLPHGWCQLARNRPQRSPRKCRIVGPVTYRLAAFDYHDLPGKNPAVFWLLQSLPTCPPTAAGTPPTRSGAKCFKHVFAVVYLSPDLSTHLSPDLSMGWIRIKVDTSALFPSSQHISAVRKMAYIRCDYPPLASLLAAVSLTCIPLRIPTVVSLTNKSKKKAESRQGKNVPCPVTSLGP